MAKSKTEQLCINSVIPMLRQIAELIDDAVENGKQEEVSEIIELMKSIADDNWMFLRT